MLKFHRDDTLLLTVLLVAPTVIWAAEPDPAALVAQLGSGKYAEREDAQHRLRELGGKAVVAVKRGLTVADAETARRCRELLPVIRADEWERARAALKDKNGREPDHPVWKRYREIAGNDAGSRKLFIDMISDEQRAKLLDEVFDTPDAAGQLYAAEIARVEKLCRYGISKNEELKRKGMVVGAIAYHPSNAEFATLLLVGTVPATAKVVPDDGTGERVVLFDSIFKMGHGGDVRPAIQRLLAAWTEARGQAGAVDAALELGKEWWMPEMLPVARRIAANEKWPSKLRTKAAEIAARK